jgi:hypothetical protein
MSVADTVADQPHATVRPLRWRAHLIRPIDPQGRAEFSVEMLVARAADYVDHDLLGVLAAVRPDLTDQQIHERVDELIDLAGDVDTAVTPMHLSEAIADYKATLTDFVRVTR